MPARDTASSALTDAAAWIQGLLLGSVATTCAVLAVAAIGFLMLTGRIEPLRAGVTIIGCAVLFSAPVIARALLDASGVSASGSPSLQPTE